MPELLKKELTLSASPLTYLFLLFTAMTMLPGYPILVGAFFVCLGIFYSFQSGREWGDILFTAMLPVAKGDVVRAKFAFTAAVELAALLLDGALTALRMALLAEAPVYTGNQLMNANPAYLGYVLLIFALFNLLFLGGFFRTAHRIGGPFLAFALAAVALIGLAETLHHLPGLAVLNATRPAPAQWGVLLLGLAAWGGGTAWSLGRSVRRFEELDL